MSNKEKCLICDLEFGENEFIIHMHKNHSGKAYVCKYYKQCKRSYTSKDLLKRHVRDEHPEKTEMSTQTVATANMGVWICVDCGRYDEDRNNHQCAEAVPAEQNIPTERRYIMYSGKFQYFHSIFLIKIIIISMTDGRLEEIMDEGDMIVTQPSNEHPYEVDPNTSVSNNLIQSSPIDRSSQQLYVLDSTRGILFPLQAANQPVIASFGIEHQQGTEYHTVQLEAGEKENNPEEDPRSEEVISTSKQIIDAAAVFSPSEQDINATEAIAASTIPISPSKFKVKSQIKSQNRLIP